MLDSYGDRVVEVLSHGIFTDEILHFIGTVERGMIAHGSVPDFRDPATYGCLFEIARALIEPKMGDNKLCVGTGMYHGGDTEKPEVAVPTRKEYYPGSTNFTWVNGDTRAEALIAAIEFFEKEWGAE